MTNETNFDEIYRRNKPKLQSYVARRVYGDSAEIVDEIFLTAWRRRADMPQEPEAQLMWLYAVGRRTIANHLRFHARLDLFSRTSTSLAETSTSNHSSETSILVHDCLKRLKKSDREILLLIEWDDLTIHQAATVLKITEAAATKRLKSAREAFAALYSAQNAGH